MKRLSEEIESFFAAGQKDLEKALREIIAPDGEPIPNLDDAMAYALGLDKDAANPGKRIRPLLCLLACRDLCGDYRRGLPFAVAIELMHNFCLVHDDIEDGDEFRRGRPAVWKAFGVDHAINVGDYLFTKIFKALMLESSNQDKAIRQFELMRKTLEHTHRGQALDMNARKGEITVDEYMHLVTEKTGHYLAAPLLAAAIVSDADADVYSALGVFGLMIGPMFQIRDDVIDLTHGKGREAVGSDVREGKRSFLVAYTLENASEADAAHLLAILDLPRNDTTPEMIEEVLGLFKKYGALEEADKRCELLRSKAMTALDSLPEKLNADLRQVTDYLVARTA